MICVNDTPIKCANIIINPLWWSRWVDTFSNTSRRVPTRKVPSLLACLLPLRLVSLCSSHPFRIIDLYSIDHARLLWKQDCHFESKHGPLKRARTALSGALLAIWEASVWVISPTRLMCLSTSDASGPDRGSHSFQNSTLICHQDHRGVKTHQAYKRLNPNLLSLQVTCMVVGSAWNEWLFVLLWQQCLWSCAGTINLRSSLTESNAPHTANVTHLISLSLAILS